MRMLSGVVAVGADGVADATVVPGHAHLLGTLPGEDTGGEEAADHAGDVLDGRELAVAEAVQQQGELQQHAREVHPDEDADAVLDGLPEVVDRLVAGDQEQHARQDGGDDEPRLRLVLLRGGSCGGRGGADGVFLGLSHDGLLSGLLARGQGILGSHFGSEGAYALWVVHTLSRSQILTNLLVKKHSEQTYIAHKLG